MKKITSLILALVMALSLTVTALAADPVPGKVTITDFDDATTRSIEIPADYENTATPEAIPTKYYVYMEWNVASSLKYTVDANSYEWKVYSDEAGENEMTAEQTTANTQPKSAGYAINGTWSGKATVSVKVENWSNKDVKVSYTFDGAAEAGDVTKAFTFNQTAWNLPSAAQTITTKADHTSTALVTAVSDGGVNFTIQATEITAGAIKHNVTSIGTLTVTVDKTA